MTNISAEKPQKSSKRLVLKITSLSLASLFAFAIIAYISFNNYEHYNHLLKEQQVITQKLSTLKGLQQNLLNLQKYTTQESLNSSSLPIDTVMQKIEKAFSTLKDVNNPLLTRAFSQFLEVKKQTKTLKAFLAKRATILKQTPLNQKKISWLNEQSNSQKKRISDEIAPLFKHVQALKHEQKQIINMKSEDIKSFESDTLNTLYIILGILALAVFCIHFIAAYLISKPLTQITQRMRDINDGKVSGEVHGTERNDEFGDIARMLQAFRENALKIEQMQQHLQQTIAESKKSTQIKNQFMARMSHELRTPLNAIIGYSEMIVDSVNDKMDLKQLRNDINQIADAGQNLLTMVDSVLELTEDDDENSVKTENFNVREEVQQVLPALEVIILKNKNKFKVHCPDASLMMDSDPKKIKRVLINLIKNAANFTKNGQLTLDIIAANLGDLEAVCFKVKDTGCGIESSKIGSLFNAFEQKESSSTKTQGGAGLGLAIVKKITDDLHGQVSVESTLNQGSTFTVILPCHYKQADERAQKIMLSPLAEAV